MREQYDEREGYCRSLGHFVRFAYCRAPGGSLPCARIAECWSGRLPVEDFLHGHYSVEEVQRIFAPRPGKLASIVEIVQRLGDPRPPS